MSRRGCQRIRSVNLFLPSFFLPFSQDLLRLSGVVVGFFFVIKRKERALLCLYLVSAIVDL